MKQNPQCVLSKMKKRVVGGEQPIRCVLIKQTFVGQGAVKVRLTLREAPGTCESVAHALQKPYKADK